MARRQAGHGRGRDVLVRGAGDGRRGADVQAVRRGHHVDRGDRRPDGRASTLEQPNAALPHLVPRQDQPDPEARLGADLPTGEQARERRAGGRGDARSDRARSSMSTATLQQEIVLEANPDHWSAPKMERWILRIIPNVEATLGMLRRGEVNFLVRLYRRPADLIEAVADAGRRYRRSSRRSTSASSSSASTSAARPSTIPPSGARCPLP